jgi:hypothetical protein
MHRPVKAAYSSFIEGSHTTKNTASGSITKLHTMKKKKKFSKKGLLLQSISLSTKKSLLLLGPIQKNFGAVISTPML